MGLQLVWSSNSFKASVQQSKEYFIWEIFQLACINCENGKKEQACTFWNLKLNRRKVEHKWHNLCWGMHSRAKVLHICLHIWLHTCILHKYLVQKYAFCRYVLAQLENKWQKWCWGMLAGRLGCVPLRGCGMTKRQMLSVTEAPINTPAIWHPCSR